ncbi:MAG: peptidoglycan DD-metalloendopeptidase family protein [Candidatus Eisenbacteria bacterium]|nr:peptidoglycan DD-metalloendopeptidase family protein [Candidatus Eisenbacteria bacterium]
MAEISRSEAMLQRAGLLLPADPLRVVSFDWPLSPWNGLSDYGYHGISALVDHDPSYPDHLRDYECGTRTYDQANGYNHRGTDFFTWPFSWYKMDHDQVAVVAAAPGQITLKSNGHYDRNCGTGADVWNAVYVRHADGSTAWYGHMKNGSLTSKPVGALVEAGEYLGIVGSSGNSTGPHLHLEVYDAGGHLIDPWAGPCNGTIEQSWWTDQRPYYDSAVNAVLTHWMPPSFPPCPQTEDPRTSDVFSPGAVVYFAAYYRDQLQGQLSEYTVRRPDGMPQYHWTHSSPAPYYAASYWYWNRVIPSGAPLGVWTFEVVFEGETYTHSFVVGTEADVNAGELAGAGVPWIHLQAFPNPFEGETKVSWDRAAGDGERAGARAGGRTVLAIHDASGRRVRVWALSPGAQSFFWNGEDESGRRLPPGIYVARLDAGGATGTLKLIVSR